MLALRPVEKIVTELSGQLRKPTVVSRKARETLAAELPPDFLLLVDEGDMLLPVAAFPRAP